jgi:phosphohistidine phosphatase
MDLYLMRHASAVEPVEWRGDDSSRPLTEEGEGETSRIADFLGRTGIAIRAIVSSPYARALATARIMAARLMEGREPETDAALSPGCDAREAVSMLGRLARANPEISSVLLVGHAPDTGRICSDLIGGGKIAFKKATLALITLDASLASGELRILINPYMFR